MIRLNGQFEGWVVDNENGFIYDDGNNSYSINEVRSLFFINQLHKNLIGNEYEIKSLKNELKEKIKTTQSPTIKITWGDGTEKIVSHPKFG